MSSLNGTCLCGACRFTATLGPLGAGACHCEMCRKWTGGIFLSVDCGSSAQFEQGAPIGSYKGSEWGERIFCKTCGASMMWQTQDGANQHVSIQCFDDPSSFELRAEIFVESKPSNYALAGERQMITGEQLRAMFASNPEGGA